MVIYEKSKLMPALALIVLLMPLLFQNCRKADDEPVQPIVEIFNVTEYSSLRYFHGGWYGSADVANWSHDYTLDLTTGQLVSKTTNPYCVKTRYLSAVEMNSLYTTLNQAPLSIRNANDAFMIDGGTEQITFNYRGSTMQKIVYLSSIYAPPGGLIYRTPLPVKSLVQSFVASGAALTTVCQ